MAKVKYYYDSDSLTYKRIMPSRKNIFKNAFRYIFSSIALAFIFIIAGGYFFKSPQQKSMERELENMIFQYSQIDKKIEELELVLNNVEEREIIQFIEYTLKQVLSALIKEKQVSEV